MAACLVTEAHVVADCVKERIHAGIRRRVCGVSHWSLTKDGLPTAPCPREIIRPARADEKPKLGFSHIISGICLVVISEIGIQGCLA